MDSLAMTFGVIPGLILIIVSFFSGFKGSSLVNEWREMNASIKIAKEKTFVNYLLIFDIVCLFITDSILLLIINITAIIPSLIIREVGRKERLKNGYSKKEIGLITEDDSYFYLIAGKALKSIIFAMIFWIFLIVVFSLIVPVNKITELIGIFTGILLEVI